MKKSIVLLLLAFSPFVAFSQNGDVIVNDNKNFAKEMTQWAKMLTYFKESLDTVKDTYKKIQEEVKDFKEFKKAVGEGKSVINDFKEAIMLEEMMEIGKEINEFKEEVSEDFYSVYDPLNNVYEFATDSIQKFQSAKDMREMAKTAAKQISKSKDTVFKELKKIGNSTATEQTDVGVQKQQVNAAIQVANLQELSHQELKLNNELIMNHFNNENEAYLQQEAEWKNFVDTDKEQSKMIEPKDRTKAYDDLFDQFYK